MAVNKVVYGGQTLIDLTKDTVERNKMLKGTTAHDRSGAEIEGNIESLGTQTFTPKATNQVINSGVYLSGNQTILGDSNLISENIAHGTTIFDVPGSFSSDANATSSEILSTKSAYVKGQKVIGTMPNKGGVTGYISNARESYTVPLGFHDGSGKVSIHPDELANIRADKIAENWTILGVTGTLTGTEGVNAQIKTIVPSSIEQNILPDEGYNYLSKVTVLAIPYEETNNEYGITVTIG